MPALKEGAGEMPEILLHFLSSSISFLSPLHLLLRNYSNKMSVTQPATYFWKQLSVTTFKSSNISGIVTNMRREFACSPFASNCLFTESSFAGLGVHINSV